MPVAVCPQANVTHNDFRFWRRCHQMLHEPLHIAVRRRRRWCFTSSATRSSRSCWCHVVSRRRKTDCKAAMLFRDSWGHLQSTVPAIFVEQRQRSQLARPNGGRWGVFAAGASLLLYTVFTCCTITALNAVFARMTPLHNELCRETCCLHQRSVSTVHSVSHLGTCYVMHKEGAPGLLLAQSLWLVALEHTKGLRLGRASRSRLVWLCCFMLLCALQGANAADAPPGSMRVISHSRVLTLLSCQKGLNAPPTASMCRCRHLTVS